MRCKKWNPLSMRSYFYVVSVVKIKEILQGKKYKNLRSFVKLHGTYVIRTTIHPAREYLYFFQVSIIWTRLYFYVHECRLKRVSTLQRQFSLTKSLPPKIKKKKEKKRGKKEKKKVHKITSGSAVF